ncbi:hypothetical protein KUTeg_002609 [Tegillarca granosa]|uniref:Uncharacterized protein n=1 Tax=Tegillarca granosa TaxID=220873 RepID=A0ABQ9FUT0_TEGGR|nr:hypothetical protein KUTeg_002609 [Tegillarca granosa]
MEQFKSFDLELKGDFSFPRTNIELFKYSQFFLVGGLVPMTFGICAISMVTILMLSYIIGFGAGGYYGMKFIVGAKIMSMKATAGVEPYAGLTVWGELGIGFLLYGKLRLQGNIMDLRFPTECEIGFSKFPLDVG